MSACGMLSTACICQGSCWSQRPTLRVNITSGSREAGQEGFFLQLGSLHSIHGRQHRSALTGPALSCIRNSIPIGSGSKCDVSSHGFLIRALPLHSKNAISPAFPFSVFFTHHTSSAYTYMHIWSLSVGREGDVLRSHLTQHFTEKYVKTSRNRGHTGQTNLSNLLHTHSHCPQGRSVPLEGLVAHCSSDSPQESYPGCCWPQA